MEDEFCPKKRCADEIHPSGRDSQPRERRTSDIIKRMLQMVTEAQPSFSESCAMQIEQQIRHEFGGEQITIAKRAPMLRAAREKVRAEIGIKSVTELKEEHGVSRMTLYRWIAAKKEK